MISFINIKNCNNIPVSIVMALSTSTAKPPVARYFAMVLAAGPVTAVGTLLSIHCTPCHSASIEMLQAASDHIHGQIEIEQIQVYYNKVFTNTNILLV